MNGIMLVGKFNFIVALPMCYLMYLLNKVLSLALQLFHVVCVCKLNTWLKVTMKYHSDIANLGSCRMKT